MARGGGDLQRRWGDLVDRWKATHQAGGDGVVHLIDASYSLRAVLACWPTAPVTLQLRKSVDDPWEPLQVDFDELALRAGLNERAALAAFLRLRAIGAINPDRTLHLEAADYLQKHASLKKYPMKITARIDLGGGL